MVWRVLAVGLLRRHDAALRLTLHPNLGLDTLILCVAFSFLKRRALLCGGGVFASDERICGTWSTRAAQMQRTHPSDAHAVLKAPSNG